MAIAQSRSVEKRNTILKIALKLFLEQGYERVSVDEIVRRAGGTKTNVYKHFGDKEGLFAAAVQSICREIVDFSDINLQGLTLEDALKTYGLAFLCAILEKEALKQHRMVVAESAHFPDIGRSWFNAGPERAYGAMATYFESQQKKGALRAGSSYRLAVFFLDMLSFGVHSRMLIAGAVIPRPSNLRQIVDEAVDIFLNGARFNQIAQKADRKRRAG